MENPQYHAKAFIQITLHSRINLLLWVSDRFCERRQYDVPHAKDDSGAGAAIAK